MTTVIVIAIIVFLLFVLLGKKKLREPTAPNSINMFDKQESGDEYKGQMFQAMASHIRKTKTISKSKINHEDNSLFHVTDGGHKINAESYDEKERVETDIDITQSISSIVAEAKDEEEKYGTVQDGVKDDQVVYQQVAGY